MEVNVITEAGYEESLYGLSLSFKDRAVPIKEWWTTERFIKMKKTGKALSDRDGGHNKFLESIVVWIDIEAPRYWWSEFDTYRVGTTKQSESTMHTLMKRPAEPSDFEDNIQQVTIDILNESLDTKNIQLIKAHLPESYLQRRIVCTNYKVLRNIIYQRHDHKLKLWEKFIRDVIIQIEHPELLPNPYA